MADEVLVLRKTTRVRLDTLANHHRQLTELGKLGTDKVVEVRQEARAARSLLPISHRSGSVSRLCHEGSRDPCNV